MSGVAANSAVSVTRCVVQGLLSDITNQGPSFNPDFEGGDRLVDLGESGSQLYVGDNQTFDMHQNSLTGSGTSSTTSSVSILLPSALPANSVYFIWPRSVASFVINSAMTLTGANQAGAESADSTSFEFSEPVAYEASFQDALSSGIEGYGHVEVISTSDYSAALFASPYMQSGTWTGSGIIPADVDCFFEVEDFEAYNTHAGDSSTGTGSDTLSLTFTAIPEPSSLSLLVGGGACLSRRRRRVET